MTLSPPAWRASDRTADATRRRMSWLPSPFSLFTFTSPAPTSSAAPPPPPTTNASPTPSPSARRLPAPPLRGSGLGVDARGSPSSGFKRERESSGGGRGEEEEQQAEEGSSPLRKRRRGMLGTALSTAVDAAIFTAALSYSAYQLWKSPPEQLEAHMRRKRLTNGDSPTPLPIEAPPPYSEASSPRLPTAASSAPLSPSTTRRPYPSSTTASPSQIPRRVRHIHEPRPRPSPRSSSYGSSSRAREETTASSSSGFKAHTPPLPPLPANYDPFASLPFSSSSSFSSSQNPLPSFQPYASPRTATLATEEEEDDGGEDDLEDDEEMRVVAERLRNLIETGRDALVSRPKEWEQEEVASLSSAAGRSRVRMSTGGSSTSSASTAGLASARSIDIGGGPRHSLPSSLSNSSRPPPSPSSYRQSPLSPPPAPHPRFTSSYAGTTGHSRRQSVDPTPSSLSSLCSPHSHSPHCSSFGSPLSPTFPSPASSSTSTGMRRAATSSGGSGAGGVGGAGAVGQGRRSSLSSGGGASAIGASGYEGAGRERERSWR